MYRNLFAFAIAVTFLFSACGGANSSQNQPNSPQTAANTGAATAISYELVKDSLIKPTLEVRLEYIKAKGNNSEAINKHISTLMGELCGLGDDAAKMQVTAKSIIDALLKDQEENYDNLIATGMIWSVEFFMSQSHTGKNISSLQYSNFTNLGGAHPSSYGGYETIDNATGKILTTSDIFDEAKLKPIVEKAFQAYWKSELNGSTDYEAAGFFVKDNQLPLPAQIGFEPKGGIFYYNTYEVAAYVMGPTILEIPYSELKAALKIEI